MKNQRWFFGILFLLGAAFLVVSQLGLISYRLNFWTVAASVFLLIILVKSIVYRSIPGIIFPLAIAAIIYREPLGIENFSTWAIIGVAVLLTAGLSLIFHKSWKDYINVSVDLDKPERFSKYSKDDYLEADYREVDEDEDEDELDDDWDDDDDDDDADEQIHRESVKSKASTQSKEKLIVINSRFNSTTRYLDSNVVRKVVVSNYFGETKVFFDRVHINDTLEINIDGSFGDVELFLPHDWDVQLEASTSFGDIDEKGMRSTKTGPKVYVTGSYSFGDIEIRYI